MTSPIKYTALGDSLTAGVGSFLSTDFVDRYSLMLENYYRKPVITKKIAKPKITSSQINQLLTNPNNQRNLMHSNIITVSISGNDLLRANKQYKKRRDPRVFDVAYQQFKDNFYWLIRRLLELHSLSHHSPFLINILGLYNPKRNLPYSEYWVNEFNKVLASYPSSSVNYVELNSLFNYYGPLLFSFGIHPNGDGYQVMAEQLLESTIHHF